ncbi:MAG: tRNA (N(6)-L-threonylcarbamoyladenosine(37)-C(2))-methylthiotransferase MtaB [Armatimonadetes bacterium]|nr:tRNA (N(6)-L-threonylcarbamoyladenosine(37)-C(2))-methylthiotransferase MtaB [Armatimonadota bacterium]MDW8121202.1 tRNA (N(6)-L-threonylcarbamoyladenosine(37)-C(2))-methylthiotransferase MtaB [Armatimonadota bacterium]
MEERRTFSIATLGCKVNQYDSWRLAGQLKAKGLRQVPFGVPADIVIVNSCTVTHVADAKSRKILSRARSSSPQGLVVLTGCAAELLKKKGEKVPGADLIAGNSEKENLPALLLSWLAKRTPVPLSSGDSPYGSDWSADDEPAHERVRGFLKVQDGCDKFCTFCIIPHTRGLPRSKPIKEVLKEAREMVEVYGFREIVVTGVCLSLWGKEEGNNLNDLIRRLHEVPDLLRIRLSSLDPRDLNADMIRQWRDLPLLCPHFHISLQSGDDEILERMGRGHSTAYYLNLVETIRHYLPTATVTTDILVGFPGETEQHYENSLTFVRQVNFLKVHTFRFSPRPGTPAADWRPQVPPQIAQERCQRMIAASKEMWRKIVEGFAGQRAKVLVERSDPMDGTYCHTGLTENYIRVRWTSPETRPVGSLVTVVLGKVGEEGEWVWASEVLEVSEGSASWQNQYANGDGQ